nr:immunoglobulin light chain junction region [Macaca mulatta]
CQQGQSNPRTF